MEMIRRHYRICHVAMALMAVAVQQGLHLLWIKGFVAPLTTIVSDFAVVIVLIPLLALWPSRG
jgi:hypothetical protein